MKKINVLIIIGLIITLGIVLLERKEQKEEINELTAKLDAEEKKELFSEEAKKFILLYTEGSHEYKKMVSDSFKTDASNEDSDYLDNHSTGNDKKEVNLILSKTYFSNNKYISEVIYELTEMYENYPVGKILLKSSIYWDGSKIEKFNAEIVG